LSSWDSGSDLSSVEPEAAAVSDVSSVASVPDFDTNSWHWSSDEDSASIITGTDAFGFKSISKGIKKGVKSIKKGVKSVADSVEDAAGDVADSAKKTFKKVEKSVKKASKKCKKIIGKAKKELKKADKLTKKGLKKAAKKAMKETKKLAKKAKKEGEKIEEEAKKGAKKLKKEAKKLKKMAKKLEKKAKKEIKKGEKKLAKKLKKTAKKVLKKSKTVLNKAGEVAKKGKDFAEDVADDVKNLVCPNKTYHVMNGKPPQPTICVQLDMESCKVDMGKAANGIGIPGFSKVDKLDGGSCPKKCVSIPPEIKKQFGIAQYDAYNCSPAPPPTSPPPIGTAAPQANSGGATPTGAPTAVKFVARGP
jgi:hypothetical protein